jgi:hypothetical protein
VWHARPVPKTFLCIGVQRNDSTVPDGEAAFVDEALQGAEAASPRVSRGTFVLLCIGVTYCAIDTAFMACMHAVWAALVSSCVFTARPSVQH